MTKEELLQRFDWIVEEAPVDFMGTGESSRFAAKCEREWRKEVAELRKELETALSK